MRSLSRKQAIGAPGVGAYSRRVNFREVNLLFHERQSKTSRAERDRKKVLFDAREAAMRARNLAAAGVGEGVLGVGAKAKTDSGGGGKGKGIDNEKMDENHEHDQDGTGNGTNGKRNDTFGGNMMAFFTVAERK